MSELMRLARAAATGGQVDRPLTDTAPKAEKNSTPLLHGACAACLHFTAVTGKTPDGWCGRYGATTWGSCTDGCRVGLTPKGTATQAFDARRRNVVEMLRNDSARRYAYDVAGASPTGAAASPVSVMLGLRDSAGAIVTGELTVPAERWDMAAFFACWDAQGRPS